MTIETAIGLGALASIIAGLIKKVPGFPDGYGGVLAAALNVAIYATLQIGGALGWNLSQVDNVAGLVAQLAAMLLPLLVSLASSVLTHKTARALAPAGWLSFLKRPGH